MTCSGFSEVKSQYLTVLSSDPVKIWTLSEENLDTWTGLRQHSAAQRSTAQHSAAQRSTAQHSAAQRSTAQHSAAQRSTAQDGHNKKTKRVSRRHAARMARVLHRTLCGPGTCAGLFWTSHQTPSQSYPCNLRPTAFHRSGTSLLAR